MSNANVREIVKAALEAEGVRDALVSVAFVGTGTISRLNRDYVSRSGPTDVIAFGLERGGSTPVIGDIYICPRVAERNARRLRISLKRELARLVVHGTLHVLGLDHPEDDTRVSSAMWRKQERILDSID
ncbi:MAG: rRNA maturation RNase YbeY [Gemmatimonadota bacterium]|nr:rRNA maturation RNase YbeY [Gemmatimonadota bacterium]